MAGENALREKLMWYIAMMDRKIERLRRSIVSKAASLADALDTLQHDLRNATSPDEWNFFNDLGVLQGNGDELDVDIARVGVMRNVRKDLFQLVLSGDVKPPTEDDSTWSSVMVPVEVADEFEAAVSELVAAIAGDQWDEKEIDRAFSMQDLGRKVNRARECLANFRALRAYR